MQATTKAGQLASAAPSTDYAPATSIRRPVPITQRPIVKVLAVSALLLIPCYWQSRIQAGDLASHLYNAWLAQLIEAGRADGLVIVRLHTNILFDLILGGLFRLFGAEWAQRLAVSTAVLIFAWGAFALV